MSFGNIVNIDFLSVGIAVAANLILGSIIFFRAPRNATAILFLLQTVVLSIWSVVSYVSYQVTDPSQAIIWVRLVMFFAAPNSVIFLLLMHTFPASRLRMSRIMLWVLISITIVTMAVALSPLLFPSVSITPGVAPQPTVGPGIIVFIPTGVLTVLLGVYFLIRRYWLAKGSERASFRDLLVGVVTMFSLILIFDFVFAAFLNNTRFIPLSAVFTFPFVALTFYAIVRHHLLNIKVIATEILTFVLAVATFIEVILSRDPLTLVFRAAVLVLVLSFGVLLIRSVRKEVEQREELEHLAEKLRQANAQLEELSHFKSQLLSLASHQIKSPLAAIKGFVTLLLEGLYGPITNKVKETLGKVKAAADNLIGLINTLLDLRKVEEGRMEYKFERTDLAALVKKVVDELAPLAREKNLPLTFRYGGPPAFVNADPQKFEQVIQNFVDNAIKYTEKGFVKVDLAEEGKTVTVSVSDSGAGIPADLQPHLFEEFVRDERLKKKVLGTGFGLYIARKIVEAHGGSIGAESAGVGKGSRFYVKVRKIS